MIDLSQSHHLIVMRLRAVGSGIEPLAAKSRLATLLNSAYKHPTGLAPSAIVFIRKLRDPMPGSLRLKQGSTRPPPAWEQALAASLDQLVRGAARPALGPVPANAEAVVFLDRSELLACLASDWCESRAITRWWWQSLFRSTDVAQAMLREWLDHPEYMPAALAWLAKSRTVKQFVNSLSVAQARLMLEGITHIFALGELRSALAVVPEDRREENRTAEADPSELRLRQTHKLAAIPNQAMPWLRYVPECEGAANLEQACLLGVGLMLDRAPAVVRSPDFARAVFEWHQATINESERLIRVSAALDAEDHLRAVKPQPATIDLRADGSSPAPGPQSKSLGSTADENRPSSELNSPQSRPAISHALDAEECLKPLHSAELSPTVIEQAAPVTASTEITSFVEPVQESVTIFEAQVETEMGGIFYLINLGLFMNLYGDFTTPSQPGIALPIWDFIALLGQQLSGGKIRSDRVWSLLALMAGRNEHQEPGEGFSSPDIWSVPADWPEPANGGKLCHTSLPDETGCESDLMRWIYWLMPYVRERLNQALGLTEADDLSRVLLCHRARIFVTAAHLDVFFSLDELPVEIRVSGLDRNPGWVPAAGRFIAFHFE